MKKLIEIHLGHVGNYDVDANLDIYIEASETSAFYKNAGIKATSIAEHLAVLNYSDVAGLAPAVLGVTVTEGENIAELFRDYFDTDSVKTADEDDIEHMKLVAYAADGELTAMGENPNVLEMADHINGTIATLCRQAEKITGKDMSYYAETAEIEPGLYRNMHPLTAYQLMRETYLKFAEILIAICKDYEAENEEWL